MESTHPWISAYTRGGKSTGGVDPIHGWGEGGKKKDKEYEKSRTKIKIFSSDKQNSNKNIMRYLDVECVARDSWIDPWMGTIYSSFSGLILSVVLEKNCTLERLVFKFV